MKLLIVAATAAEITPFLAHFKLPDNSLIITEKFDVLITGVGMVATAFALGKALNTNYNLVINVGIAGSFTRGLNLGEVVQITKDTLAELGAEDRENFIPLPELGFGENIFETNFSGKVDLKKVDGITVNKVHGHNENIEKTIKRYQPQTESMEGAAVFYAGKKCNISTLQVRSISNYVEPRNRENWEIGLAIKNLNAWLINFLENYEQKMTND